MDHTSHPHHQEQESPVSREELINALAANVLGLYRSTMVTNAGTYITALRQDLANPKPGDIVLDIHEWWRSADERLGVLEKVLRSNEADTIAFVRLLDGRYTTWRHALLVKVATSPFEPVQGISREVTR